MKIIINNPQPPEPTYDLVGLTKDQLRLIHRQVGLSSLHEDKEYGVSAAESQELWDQLKSAVSGL